MPHERIESVLSTLARGTKKLILYFFLSFI